MRTQRIAERLATVALLGTVFLGTSGCGFLFTQAPPEGHERMNDFACTESYIASAIDLAFTSLFVVGPLTSPNPDWDFLVWGAVTGASAAVGFHRSHECRVARRELAARQVQARPGAAENPAIPSVQAVVVIPAADTLTMGRQVQLLAKAYAFSGILLPARTFAWSSSNDSIASVSAGGLVVAHATGSVVIAARTDSVVGTASILVVPSR